MTVITVWPARLGIIILLLLIVAFVPGRSQTKIEPSLTLTYPNGGEALTARSKAAITWSRVGEYSSDSVKLEYTTNGGASWNTIVDAVGDSSYQWTVPNVNSAHCKIRLTQVAGPIGIADSVATIATDGVSGTGIRFSNDGRRIMRSDAGGTAHTLSIWDIATGALIRKLAVGKQQIDVYMFDRSGEKIVLGLRYGDTGRVEIWNIATGVREQAFDAIWGKGYANQRNPIGAIGLSPDGTELVVSSRTGACVWNISSTPRFLDTLSGPGMSTIQYSPDGKRFMWLSLSNPLTEFDAKTHLQLRGIPGSFSFGNFSSDLKYYLTTDANAQNLKLIDLSTGSTVYTIPADNKKVYIHGQVSPDGTKIIYGQQDSSYRWDAPYLNVRDIATNKNTAYIPIHGTETADFNPVDQRVFTFLSTPGMVKIWSLQHTDLSDQEFSIGNALPALGTVLFDPLKVGASHDSVFQTYITNSGNKSMHIDSIAITTGDIADFEIVSGGENGIIAPGGSRPITITFSPKKAGPRSGWMSVYTSDGAIAGELRGMGTQGVIQTSIDEINFGQVLVGDSMDLIVAAWHNSGDAPIQIVSTNYTGVFRNVFDIVQGESGQVAPGATYSIGVRFRAFVAGKVHESLIALDEYGNSHNISLEAEGVDQLSAPEEHVSPGEVRMVESLAPNPVSTLLRVGCRLSTTSDLRIQLLNLMGETVAELDLGEVGPGEQDVRFDLSSVTPGAYFLAILHGAEHETHSIVVVR